MEVQGYATQTSDHRRAKAVLEDMVSKLGHLDLTEHTLFETNDLVAHGGFGDVFIGYIDPVHLQRRLESPSRWNMTRVAIKRLRIRLGKDEKLIKVCAHFTEYTCKL